MPDTVKTAVHEMRFGETIALGGSVLALVVGLAAPFLWAGRLAADIEYQKTELTRLDEESFDRGKTLREDIQTLQKRLDLEHENAVQTRIAVERLTGQIVNLAGLIEQGRAGQAEQTRRVEDLIATLAAKR